MKRIITLVFAAFITVVAFAQAPQKMKFQAVARDNSGNVLANQSVSFKISILSGSVSGAVAYCETQNGLSTNAFGLVEMEIGNGAPVTGLFSSVNWGNNSYFVKVEMDPAGGSAYQVLSTSQLLSVPYALHAKTAENVNDADADPLNEIQSLSISGSQLTLSKDGGTVTLPLSGGTGIQGVQSSNNTLSITNPNGPIADVGLKLPFSASTSTSAATFAVANQLSGAGLVGSSAQGDGIVGRSESSSKSGIWGNNTGGGYGIAGSTSGSSTAGVWGSNSGSGFGLKGTSSTGTGIYGSTAGTAASYGIAGESTASSGTGIGAYGRSASPSGTGVYGWANNSAGTNYGVYGETGSAAGYGGYFVGRGYFSGSVGIGTTNPTAKLHVHDADGGDGSVILPDNSISAKEIKDEPGIATESSDATHYLNQNNELVTILSNIIHAPSAGFILATASFTLYAIPGEELVAYFGLSMNQNIPDPPRRFFSTWELSATVLSFPVSFSNVFKVNSGYHTFYLHGMKTGGGQEVDVVDPQMTLIFFPTAYGLVRTF